MSKLQLCSDIPDSGFDENINLFIRLEPLLGRIIKPFRCGIERTTPYHFLSAYHKGLDIGIANQFTWFPGSSN
jgi:hypothetical protein